MEINQLLRLVIVVLCLLVSSVFADGWRRIEVPNALSTVVDDDGLHREIKPGCAFSYLSDDAGVSNQAFHFYYRKGKKKDKTLIYFNGGGACWNGSTCLTSLMVGDRPTYNPAIEVENNPSQVGGILDLSHSDNPFREWSIIFIPYCTGDVHIGSKDTLYSDPLGLVNEGNPVIVQHRGFDNFMAVREWIKINIDRKDAEKILVAGSSAGSYGAILNFSRLHSLYRNKTIVALLTDAGVGVFTQPFIELIFRSGDGGPWGVERTLATWIPGIDHLGAYGAETFYQDLVTNMAGYFKKSRFAQYTTAWDSVQVYFLNVMQQTDGGSIDPREWSISETWPWLEWHARMLATLDMVSLNKNAYFYIGSGIYHTSLTDLFKPIPPTGYFYLEHSADNTFLVDWVRQLITDDKKTELRNLSCDSDCGAP